MSKRNPVAKFLPLFNRPKVEPDKKKEYSRKKKHKNRDEV